MSKVLAINDSSMAPIQGTSVNLSNIFLQAILVDKSDKERQLGSKAATGRCS